MLKHMQVTLGDHMSSPGILVTLTVEFLLVNSPKYSITENYSGKPPHCSYPFITSCIATGEEKGKGSPSTDPAMLKHLRGLC